MNKKMYQLILALTVLLLGALAPKVYGQVPQKVFQYVEPSKMWATNLGIGVIGTDFAFNILAQHTPIGKNYVASFKLDVTPSSHMNVAGFTFDIVPEALFQLYTPDKDHVFFRDVQSGVRLTAASQWGFGLGACATTQFQELQPNYKWGEVCTGLTWLASEPTDENPKRKAFPRPDGAYFKGFGTLDVGKVANLSGGFYTLYPIRFKTHLVDGSFFDDSHMVVISTDGTLTAFLPWYRVPLLGRLNHGLFKPLSYVTLKGGPGVGYFHQDGLNFSDLHLDAGLTVAPSARLSFSVSSRWHNRFYFNDADKHPDLEPIFQHNLSQLGFSTSNVFTRDKHYPELNLNVAWFPRACLLCGSSGNVVATPIPAPPVSGASATATVNVR